MIYVRIDGDDVYIRDTTKHNGKWRRVGDPTMASTVKDWVLEAISRM